VPQKHANVPQLFVPPSFRGVVQRRVIEAHQKEIAGATLGSRFLVFPFIGTNLRIPHRMLALFSFTI
jgi:hypothetical protein